jgi:hypothetical protein
MVYKSATYPKYLRGHDYEPVAAGGDDADFHDGCRVTKLLNNNIINIVRTRKGLLPPNNYFMEERSIFQLLP